MTPLHDVILASASPRRVEILQSLRFRVDVRPTNVVEGDVPGLTPRELAAHHSAAKADAGRLALGDDSPDLLVAADTVVDLDGRALGKPRDLRESRATVAALSGREHLVHTAIDVVLPRRGARVAIVETTAVRFYDLDDATIDSYVATRDGLDKAGAYGIQGAGAALVEKIDGDFYAVMGFPIARFVRILASLGFLPPVFAPLAGTVA